MVLLVMCVQLVLLWCALETAIECWKASMSIELMRLAWPPPVPPQPAARHGADAS